MSNVMSKVKVSDFLMECDMNEVKVRDERFLMEYAMNKVKVRDF